MQNSRMRFVEAILERLSASDWCAYQAGGPAATEPTAVAAIALLAHGRDDAALPLLESLLDMQNEDGSLGITRTERTPCWPTGWAALAFRASQSSTVFAAHYVVALDGALRWMLSNGGEVNAQVAILGHDTTLQGWPWVLGTHSWVEPTAVNLLALRHTRRDKHRRGVDAKRLLRDRMLQTGGCNYGNTTVMGQTLRPHVEPTGMALLALAGEQDTDGRIAQSIEYLKRELSARTPTMSLCYGLLGLAAHGAFPANAPDWLAAAAQRTTKTDPASLKLALLALAAQGNESPLVTRAWGYQKSAEQPVEESSR